MKKEIIILITIISSLILCFHLLFKVSKIDQYINEETFSLLKKEKLKQIEIEEYQNKEFEKYDKSLKQRYKTSDSIIAVQKQLINKMNKLIDEQNKLIEERENLLYKYNY